VKLTVLGSGTYLPDPERGAPGFLLQHGTTNVLVDCGSGTLQRLARAGFDPVGLDAIVITHRHIDHCADLPAILFHIKHLPSPARLRDLPIFAGTGFQAHLDALIEAYGSSLEPTAFDLVVHELPTDGPGHTTIEEGLELDTQPAVHAAGALHLRFRNEEGLTVAFSGDTGPSEALEQLAAGADLFVCECALADGQEYPFHLSAKDVAELVAAARPRRAVLTHLYPRHDPGADLALVASTGVPTLLARDGLEIVVSRPRP
jgi:ribonuclease BN (tRNA processing enzyme)